MKAIRLHPAPPENTSYSPSNPAPSTALQMDHNVPIPEPSAPGELLVRVKATTIIRDMLTWPETYAHDYAIIGNDVAGVVTKAFSPNSGFKVGDEVFGMTAADRAATWAEYTIVKEDEITRIPVSMTFTDAAALPLSVQTAYEALFVHARLPRPTVEEVSSRSVVRKDTRVLITGAAGAVGLYLVQLAAAAGVWVVAASSSNERNEEFLRSLGADEVVQYSMLGQDQTQFDVIVDVVGGEVLANCWDCVAEDGVLISVDSSSFNFPEEHGKRGLRKPNVRALFFIVKGCAEAMRYVADLVEADVIQPFVAHVYPLGKVQEAYELASRRLSARGKIVLVV